MSQLHQEVAEFCETHFIACCSLVFNLINLFCSNSTSSLRQIINLTVEIDMEFGFIPLSGPAFTFNDVYLFNQRPVPQQLLNGYVMNITGPSPSSEHSGSPLSLNIATFSLINITDVSTMRHWPKTSLTAVECSLSLCIQEIQSNVTNGTLTETIATKTAEPVPFTLPTSITVLGWPSTLADGNENINIHDPNEPSEQYTISLNSFEGLNGYFEQFFPGTPLAYNTSTGQVSFKFGLNVVPLTNNSATPPSPEVEVFYNSTNLTDTLANVATAMSHSMRQYADGSPRAQGSVGIEQTKVVIRWAWLSLPLGIIILGILFLGITAWKTRRMQLPLWKAEQLPLLFHISPADDQSVSDSKLLTTTSAMDDRARSVRIRLHRDHGNTFSICTMISQPLSKTTQHHSEARTSLLKALSTSSSSWQSMPLRSSRYSYSTVADVQSRSTATSEAHRIGPPHAGAYLTPVEPVSPIEADPGLQSLMHS